MTSCFFFCQVILVLMSFSMIFKTFLCFFFQKVTFFYCLEVFCVIHLRTCCYITFELVCAFESGEMCQYGSIFHLLILMTHADFHCLVTYAIFNCGSPYRNFRCEFAKFVLNRAVKL